MTTPPPPPESLALLIEHLGLDDTLRLIEARGGTQIWAPKGVDNSSEPLRAAFIQEFGETMTRALIRGFGGGPLWVPLCPEWRTALYAHRGLTPEAIARKLCCHIDTVRRRLKRGWHTDRPSGWAFGARGETRQASLEF
jgi:hypothetical protein